MHPGQSLLSPKVCLHPVGRTTSLAAAWTVGLCQRRQSVTMGAVPRRASAVPAAIPQAVGIPPPAHVRQRWAWTGAGEGSLATLRARPFGLADPRGMPGHPPTSPNPSGCRTVLGSFDRLPTGRLLVFRDPHLPPGSTPRRWVVRPPRTITSHQGQVLCCRRHRRETLGKTGTSENSGWGRKVA